MKAVTFQPEEAEGLACGRVSVAVRSWAPSHRGSLAIHAAKPESAILGVAILVDVERQEDGTVVWGFINARRLQRPVACRGQMKVWPVPGEVAEEILNLLVNDQPVPPRY